MRSAFTITEMLVVLVIMTLLVSMAMPTYQGVRSRANTTVCETRLRSLAEAYHGRRSDRFLTNRLPFEAEVWARELKPYLTNNINAYRCPEDKDAVAGLPNVRIAAKPYGNFAYYLDVVTAYPFWNEYTGATCPGGGAGVWRLSNEQYQAIAPSIREGYNITAQLPQYDPGPNPNVYWYLFEDQRYGEDLFATGDKDYEDIILRFEEYPDGSVDVYVTKGYTIFDFDLVGPDDVVYENVTGNNAGPFEFDGVGYISYGMNWQADETMAPTMRRILLVDYEEDLCEVGGELGGGDWDILHAPRHRGRVNVAFASGAVETMDPTEIDPGNEASNLFYWDPTSGE